MHCANASSSTAVSALLVAMCLGGGSLLLLLPAAAAAAEGSLLSAASCTRSSGRSLLACMYNKTCVCASHFGNRQQQMTAHKKLLWYKSEGAGC
jgi:hypothetical protein